MKNLKLSVKLMGAFILVSLITLIVGLAGWHGIYNLNGYLKKNSQVRLPSLIALGTMIEGLTGIQRYERVLVYEKNSEIVNRQYTQLEEAWKRTERGFKSYESLPKTAEETRLWKDLAPKWEEWKNLHQQIIGLVKKGDDPSRQAAYTLSYGKARDAYMASSALLRSLIVFNEKGAAEEQQSADREAVKAGWIVIIGMILGALIALAFGIISTLAITRPIKRVIVGLTDGVEQVASNSTQIASSSQSLAEGASEQAAGLEETSSSMEEMSSMTKQNADNANQANTLMQDTGRVVEEANRAMKELIESMNGISTASEETGKIIKTIDEIAFQTNLLALNAAVEAARAGEAGAGFAVVADEVRNLAMRAAEAAKNTADLIEGTVKKVKSGSDIVLKTNEAFEKVSAGAKKVAGLVGEISAASYDQAQGIEQINKAVIEMDRVVQQNAANAEESASASQEMNAQAKQMKDYAAWLTTVIGGNHNGLTSNTALPVGKGKGGNRAALARNRNSLEQKGLLRPATKDRGKKKTTDRMKEITPEQIIPLEEGEFNEF